MATLSNAEKKFLKQLASTVSRQLNLAWMFTVISTLLFVWQSWLLAMLFSTWLTNYFNETPLSMGVSSTWFIGLLLCFVARPLFGSGRELISSRASLTVRSQLRESLLTTMAKLGPNLRHFGSDGSISSQIIDQTDALDGFISSFSVQKKVAASTPIILLIAIAWQSLFSAALLLVTAPLVPIFMILIGNLTAQKSAKQFAALAQLSGRFLDWIRGTTTLKRLQATEAASTDLAISSEDYRRRTMDVLKIAFLNGAVLELLAALSIALVAVYLGFGLMGILPWDKGHVPVEYFGALFILLLAPEFYLPLRQLGTDYHAKSAAEGAIQSLLPIIHAAQQSNVDISTKGVDSKAKNTVSQFDASQPFGLQFTELGIYSNVTPEKDDHKNSKTSSSSEQPIYRTRLSPVSFTVNAGERIGLVGDSGSGKSSLLQAVMGFVHYEGSIDLLSVERTHPTTSSQAPDAPATALKNIDPEYLRQHIGYLAQQVALMPLTIAENLRLANPKATEQQLIEALDMVDLWTLIQCLPEGVHTQLGGRGQGLSGGQQQRLGIAQLLLREDSLWLLDEPTEHLDPDTAQHVNSLLERVSRGKTVIWITHAIESLEWLDRVITLSLPSPTIHEPHTEAGSLEQASPSGHQSGSLS